MAEEKEDENKVQKTKKKFFPVGEDVITMAENIIRKYHPELRTAGANIKYSYRDGTWNKNGEPCLGEVKKISPYVKVLTEYIVTGDNRGLDFGILLNYRAWLELMTEEKEALLDHLLSCCDVAEGKDGEPKFVKVNPTVSEFPDVVKRHGGYNPQLKYMGEAFDEYKNKENDNGNE